MTDLAAPGLATDDSVLARTTVRAVAIRLLPFLMLAYFLAFIDRVNAGFAALQMNQDIGLSPAAFGLGGGLFFIAYVIFEVPSNLIMQKVGARLWIARVMITWGLVAAGMAFVAGPTSFYVMRVLLGVAEAGLFPGVILYLTYWFPRAWRGRIVAAFMVAIPVSNFVGSPLSAALLGLEGVWRLHGWQWMFLLEGLPATLLGLVTLAYLRDGPDQVAWLKPEQKAWLEQALAREQAGAAAVGDAPLWRVMTHPNVLAAALIYAGSSGASSCLALWQPQILKAYGLTNLQTGWLNAPPFGIAAVAMIWWGHRSDRTGERIWHTAIPLSLIAVSMGAALFVHGLWPVMLLLCLAVTGTYALKGPFWALSSEWLSPATAAAGIAQINAIGNIGGFAGTSVMGWAKQATGGYTLGLALLAVLAGLGVVVLAAMSVMGKTRTAT